MLATLLLLPASIVNIGYCGRTSDAPWFDPQETTIDCTKGRTAQCTCDITLIVVEYHMSMTYYNITKDFVNLRRYRLTAMVLMNVILLSSNQTKNKKWILLLCAGQVAYKKLDCYVSNGWLYSFMWSKSSHLYSSRDHKGLGFLPPNINLKNQLNIYFVTSRKD